MEYHKFGEFPRGTLFQMLLDAYSPDPESVELNSADWEEFDHFVYDNLDIMEGCGFVSVLGGRPVGFITWDPRGLPGRVDIGHNCIVRGFGGGGLGGKQLSRALELIRGLGPERIVVRTGGGKFFEPARRMYASAGFRAVEHGETAHEVVEYEMIL